MYMQKEAIWGIKKRKPNLQIYVKKKKRNYQNKINENIEIKMS